MKKLELNTVHKGETENGRKLNVGDVVEYLGHIGGQCVKIKFPDGTVDEAHPLCFREMRQIKDTE